jgi:hypothetical protein
MPDKIKYHCFTQCDDCGRSPYAIYMVYDSVWQQAGLDPDNNVCESCLELRLGRQLVPQDFPISQRNSYRDLARTALKRIFG